MPTPLALTLFTPVAAVVVVALSGVSAIALAQTEADQFPPAAGQDTPQTQTPGTQTPGTQTPEIRRPESQSLDCPPGQFASPFSDVYPTHWAYQAVLQLSAPPLQCFDWPQEPPLSGSRPADPS